MGLHMFWMQVYIAAIRAGNGPHYAEQVANLAIQSFKRLDVDKHEVRPADAPPYRPV